MIKIALTGQAGAGKGVVSDILQELYPELTKGSFAYPIKEFFRQLCNMTDVHLYGELKEVPLTFIITPDSYNNAAKFYLEYGLDDYVSFDRMWSRFTEVLHENIKGMNEDGIWVLQGISSRRLQQLFGTEIIRHFKDSTWIDIALDKQYNIIDDLRFLNEDKKLKQAGYLIVRIVGKATRIADGTAKMHASELELMSIQENEQIQNYFEVYDSNSRAELKSRVVALIEKYN